MQQKERNIAPDSIDDFFSEIAKDVERDFSLENSKDKFGLAVCDIFVKEKVYHNSALTCYFFTERLGIDRREFVKLFQSYFGMSFRMFVQNIRLREALLLLEHSDLSIQIIAQKVGFGTIRSFQRCVQSVCNMSPKDYRKAKLKDREQLDF